MTPSKSGRVGFMRDRRTWFSYLTLSIFGFMQSVLGSVTPFLRDELHYSRGEIGLHFTFYAAGLVASGLIGGQLIRRIPTLTLMRVGVTVMIASIVSIGFAFHPAVSLTSACAMGLTGGMLQATTQTEIASYQRTYQEIAFTEAFVLAGLGVFSGPLVFGVVSSFAPSWRYALLVPVVAMLALLVVFRTIRDDAATEARHPGIVDSGGLSINVILCWLLVFLGITAEWGIGFWGAQFLEARLNVQATTAVSLMSVFFGGTVFGRIVSSRLLTRFDGRFMLLAVIIVSDLAIAVTWFSSSFAIVLSALALAGMCLGNFFPLIVATAMRLAPDRLGLVSTGSTQAVGLALLVAPITLGLMAESMGLVNAVGTLVVIPVLMILTLFLALGMRGVTTAVPTPTIKEEV